MFMVEFEGWLFSSELCGWDEEVAYACGEGNVYLTGIENEFGNSNGGKKGLGVVFFATSLQYPFCNFHFEYYPFVGIWESLLKI